MVSAVLELNSRQEYLMMRFFTEEFTGIWQFLKRNGNEIIVILSATLFMTLDHYHPIKNDWLSSFIYYAIAPILVILIFLRKNPLDFGLGIGNPRLWIKYLLVICPIAAVILLVASFMPSMQSYYKMENFNFLNYFLISCVSLSSQEYIYRGFLVFGLEKKFKEGSIFIQMIPFALLHLGKPELETISTLFTGILFGYVVYRGKSFWPAFIIHLFINVFFVTLINI
jgi:membrane protease YdiL (CAAX protease family)